MSSVPKIPDHITGKEIARHNKLLNEISDSLRALSEEDQFLIDNIMKMTSRNIVVGWFEIVRKDIEDWEGILSKLKDLFGDVKK